LKKQEIFKNSVVINILNLARFALSFFFTLYLAWLFGAGRELDIFYAATTLPFAVAVIFNQAFSVAFTPILIKSRENDPEELYRKNIGFFFNNVVIVMALLSLALAVLAEPLVRITLPGFGENEIRSAALLLRIMTPILLFDSAAGYLSGIVYAGKKYFLPSASLIARNAVIIIAIAVLSGQIGIKSAAWGNLSGSFAGFLFLCPVLLREYSFPSGFRSPYGRKSLYLILPWVFANVLGKCWTVIERAIASFFTAGVISALFYGFKLLSTIMAFSSLGINVMSLPTFAEAASRNDPDSFRETLNFSLRYYLNIMVPAIAGFTAVRRPFIEFVFQRKNFSAEDTIITSLAVLGYAVGIIFLGFGDILRRAFYAMNDTITVTVTVILKLILNITLALVLIGPMSFMGLPAAFSVSIIFETIFLGFLFNRKIENWMNENLRVSFGKIILNTLLMVLTVWLLGTLKLGLFYVLVLQILGGICAYLVFSVITGNNDVLKLLGKVKERME